MRRRSTRCHRLWWINAKAQLHDNLNVGHPQHRWQGTRGALWPQAAVVALRVSGPHAACRWSSAGKTSPTTRQGLPAARTHVRHLPFNQTRKVR
jgi:hypothetical protein